MISIQRNIILSPHTTFHIGGPADFFVVVHSSEEIVEAVGWAKDPSAHSGQELPFFILGTGANILVGDKGFRGLVIKNESSEVIINGSMLTAASGATIANLIEITAQKGLSGL